MQEFHLFVFSHHDMRGVRGLSPVQRACLQFCLILELLQGFMVANNCRHKKMLPNSLFLPFFFCFLCWVRVQNNRTAFNFAWFLITCKHRTCWIQPKDVAKTFWQLPNCCFAGPAGCTFSFHFGWISVCCCRHWMCETAPCHGQNSSGNTFKHHSTVCFVSWVPMRNNRLTFSCAFFARRHTTQQMCL